MLLSHFPSWCWGMAETEGSNCQEDRARPQSQSSLPSSLARVGERAWWHVHSDEDFLYVFQKWNLTCRREQKKSYTYSPSPTRRLLKSVSRMVLESICSQWKRVAAGKRCPQRACLVMRVALLQAARRALEQPVLCSLSTLLPACTSAPCCVLIHSHSKLDVLIRLHLLQSGFPRKSETRTWVQEA